MNFKGIEEVSFYKNDQPYAAHVAVFGSGKNKTYVAIETLSKALLENGFERTQLRMAGIKMLEIEYAHKDVSFQRVHHSITGRTFPMKKAEDFLVNLGSSRLQRAFSKVSLGENFPFKSTAIIGEPAVKRSLFVNKSAESLYNPKFPTLQSNMQMEQVKMILDNGKRVKRSTVFPG